MGFAAKFRDAQDFFVCYNCWSSFICSSFWRRSFYCRTITEVVTGGFFVLATKPSGKIGARAISHTQFTKAGELWTRISPIYANFQQTVRQGAFAHCPRNQRAFCSEFRVYAAKGGECSEPSREVRDGTPSGGGVRGALPKSNRSADSHVRALRTPVNTSKTPPKRSARTQRSALQAFGQHALKMRPVPTGMTENSTARGCTAQLMIGLATLFCAV